MVVKREKKLTKKRKVTTKKKSKSKTINKNINTQTVIINQPKPTRRRKSTTKKTDKFSDPTSSLGIITNLITRFQPTQQPNDQLQQLTESVKQLQLQAPPLTQPPPLLMPEPLSRSNPSMASSMDFSTAETTNPDAFRENIKQPPERPYNLRSFSNVSDLTMEQPLSRNAPVKKADGSLASVASPPPIPPPPMDKRKPATKKEPVIPPNQTTIPFATQKAQAELTQAMTSYEKMKIRYEEALRNDKIKKSTLQSYKSQLKTAEKKVEDVRLKNAIS
jgi:hypothetical protein